MKLRSKRLGALALGALMAATALSAPALAADNYQVRDGNGSILTMAAKLVAGVFYPRHIWTITPPSGTPTDVKGDAAGNIGVIVAGFQLATGVGSNAAITVAASSHAAGVSEGGLITLSGASQSAGGNFTLGALSLSSAGGSTNAVWIYAWTKSPSATCTDNVTFAANSADKGYLLPGFPMQVTLGGAPGSWDTRTFAQVTGLAIPALNQDATPTTNLYACLVTGASVTPASTSDLVLTASGWD